MPEQHSDYDVVFSSSALSSGDLYLHRMDGQEGISSLYEFELLVSTTTGGALEFDQVDQMLAGTAYLAFGADEQHKIHGVIREIEMQSMSDPSPVFYRIRMVPKFFDATLTFGSWVYQDLSVPDIIKDVLNELGFAEGDDYELRMSGSHAPHEYVVQYQETDFNFLSRWMEHEGIFYWFEHGEDRAKIVFADGNNALQPLEGHETISYEPRGNVTQLSENVHALSRVMRTIPSRCTLRDYNYRTPSVNLISPADIDSAGVGQQVYYGEHFKDLDAGRRLARLRSQEWMAQKETYRGSSSVRGLRAGHKFTLENHLLSAMDQQYLVTSLRHSVSQGGLSDGSGSQSEGYRNEFTAMPYAIPYRPQRLTPKPRIYGIIHGKIDAPEDGDRATPLDEYGRYKVLLPFDVGGEGGGRASRWIRMAQPASGGGYGVQFPLHIGTEVALIHVDGDPDRPLIMASVPNHETRSPVTSANATQSSIRTRHGISVTFDDHSG